MTVPAEGKCPFPTQAKAHGCVVVRRSSLGLEVVDVLNAITSASATAAAQAFLRGRILQVDFPSEGKRGKERDAGLKLFLKLGGEPVVVGWPDGQRFVDGGHGVLG